jgi:tetratricopeptide (TPR) repeat protein
VFETKDYKKAVAELEKALPCNNQNPFMYRLLGYSYYETGDFTKGLENINKFMDMATSKGSPKILASDYAYKGKLLAKSGQDSLGVLTIQKAIELDPTYIEGYSDIAGIYSKAKRYADAASYYERKINASGENPSPLDFYYLGQSLYFAKDYAKADAAFEKAASKYPDANFWRGRCNFKLDNQETPEGLATPHFTKFIELVGGDAASAQANKKNLIESYSYLGFFYYTKQNFACSKAAWLSVKALDPANEKATIALTDKDILAAVETDCTEFKTQAAQ